MLYQGFSFILAVGEDIEELGVLKLETGTENLIGMSGKHFASPLYILVAQLIVKI